MPKQKTKSSTPDATPLLRVENQAKMTAELGERLKGALERATGEAAVTLTTDFTKTFNTVSFGLSDTFLKKHFLRTKRGTLVTRSIWNRSALARLEAEARVSGFIRYDNLRFTDQETGLKVILYANLIDLLFLNNRI